MMLISLAAVALCAGNVAAHPAFSKHPEGDLIGMHADARLESDESVRLGAMRRRTCCISDNDA